MTVSADPYAKTVQGAALGTPINIALIPAKFNTSIFYNQVLSFQDAAGAVAPAIVGNYAYIGTGWAPMEGNRLVQDLSLQTLTTTTAGASLTNSNGQGISVIVVAAGTAAGTSLTVKVQYQDPSTGNFFDLPGAVMPAITGDGTYLLQIHPALTPVANVAVSACVPRGFKMVYTVAGAGASVIVSSYACLQA